MLIKTSYKIAKLILISCLVFSYSCNTIETNEIPSELQQVVTDTSITVQKDSSAMGLPPDTTDYEHATYFVVIADTNANYFSLHMQMIEVSKKLNIPIDTMGRYFNKEKKLIALPDNDEDEIYAGSYYPRRFPSENLSLEYLSWYQGSGTEKTIALVSGIYEAEYRADSALSVLKGVSKKAFKFKTNMFVGCMH